MRGAVAPLGASWGADDTIVYGLGPEGVWRVSAAGGVPEQVITLRPGEGAHGPQVLPDGRTILFTLGRGSWDEAEIVVQAPGDTAPRVVGRGRDARYLPTGHLVYALGGTVFAVPFDASAMRVAGGPVPVVEDVSNAGVNSGASHYAVSADGTLAYIPGFGGAEKRTLAWVDRQGREEAIPVPPRAYVYPRLSPDGSKVALDIREESNDIWIWDLARRTLTRLTFDPGLTRGPVWSPDGRRVACSAVRDGAENIYWQAADDSGSPEQLTREKRGALPTGFSPDGTKLMFLQPPGTAPRDIGVVTVGSGKVDLLVNTPFDDTNGEISPDGRWMAYQSTESGQEEVYVRPFPDAASGRWQISNNGGTRPLWARNGRELFYYAQPGSVMGVTIEAGATFVASTPKTVVAGAYPAPLNARTYDVSPDGRRFLLIKNVKPADDAAAAPRIIVVQNWFEELKRRLPTP